MKRRTLFVGAIVVLAVAFFAAMQLYGSRQAQQAAQVAAKNREFLVRAHSPSIGRADAPVQIVEFFDPACGTCRSFYPLVKQIVAANRDKIRLSVRYAPFHPGSDDVVKALEAARQQGLLWQAIEALFAGQSEWTVQHKAHIELAWPYLQRAGVDLDRVRSDMQSPEVARVIQQDLDDARALNVTMTPEFFVNGRPLPSFGFEQLKALIDEELAKAAAQ